MDQLPKWIVVENDLPVTIDIEGDNKNLLLQKGNRYFVIDVVSIINKRILLIEVDKATAVIDYKSNDVSFLFE